MTDDPVATVERWERQLGSKQPPDALSAFLRREYPAALREAEGHGVPLVATHLLRSFKSSRIVDRPNRGKSVLRGVSGSPMPP